MLLSTESRLFLGSVGALVVMATGLGRVTMKPGTTGIAYVLETEQRFVGIDGQQGPLFKRTLAHRADGQRSLTMYYPRPDGRTYPERRMLNPHTGGLTIVSYATASTTTEYLPEAHAERYNEMLPDPLVECVTPLEGRYFTPREIKGRAKILGVDVVELTFDDGIARGRVWRAPSLNCEALREDIEIVDLIPGRLTRTATMLGLGEPPADLFEIPREFQ